MKKNRLLILASTALLALTGCNGTSGGGGSGGKTEITIWTTYNDEYQVIINNCIAEFESTHPNVSVKNIKQQGSYDDLKKMVTDGFAVDNYPDIVAAYPDAANNFLLNAKALDVTKYMNDPEIGWTQDDFDDIPEAYIALGQQYPIPGTYSLPASKSTEAMYYNQDVLIGLSLADVAPEVNSGKPLTDAYFQKLTWEELFDVLIPALELKDAALRAQGKSGLIDKDTKSDWAWVGYDSDDNLFITLAEQYGYGYTSVNPNTGKGQLDYNNDNMKNLMRKFKGYYDKHYFTTKGVIKENVNYRSTIDCMLFSIGSTGGVKYQFSASNPHNVGVAPVPHPKNGKKRQIAQGPDFAFLNHGSERRARATWEFFKLFTSTKYNTAWALQTGYSPIRYSVMETTDYADYSDYESKKEQTLDRLTALNAMYAASVGDYMFSSPVFKGSDEARQQVGTIFAAIVAGEYSVDQIFQTAVDNTLLKM